MSLESPWGRRKYLPLEKLDKCAHPLCQNINGKDDVKLRLCTSCGETAYCSQECQKRDWKAHKLQCGKTDRVDIQSFYPLLATIISSCHMHPDHLHPALSPKIINCPSSDAGDIDVVDFPDGSSARLVLLGEQFDKNASVGSELWWPTAPTEEIRNKLARRIVGDGSALPTVLATAIALVAEMYTTTAVPQSHDPDWYLQVTERRRVRLTYDHSPIADFGIVRGTVTVTAEDRLAFYGLNQHKLLMGQSPEDHYWMYFTTLSGQEYFLDCNMFAYNLSVVVSTEPYKLLNIPDADFAPAFWFGREIARLFPFMKDKCWTPIRKLSLLREPRLDHAIRALHIGNGHCGDTQIYHTLMEEVAGRICTTLEKEMVATFLPQACAILRLNMKTRTYINFPKQPVVRFLPDPGENLGGEESDEDKAFLAYMVKQSRKLKKGKISTAQWEAAFHAGKFSHDARMKTADSSR